MDASSTLRYLFRLLFHFGGFLSSALQGWEAKLVSQETLAIACSQFTQTQLHSSQVESNWQTPAVARGAGTLAALNGCRCHWTDRAEHSGFLFQATMVWISEWELGLPHSPLLQGVQSGPLSSILKHLKHKREDLGVPAPPAGCLSLRLLVRPALASKVP